MIFDIVSGFGDFLFSTEHFIFRQTLCLVNLIPNMETDMDGKSTAPTGWIDHTLMGFRIEHSHAHVNHIARGEKLPLFALRILVGKVFKGILALRDCIASIIQCYLIFFL